MSKERKIQNSQSNLHEAYSHSQNYQLSKNTSIFINLSNKTLPTNTNNTNTNTNTNMYNSSASK